MLAKIPAPLRWLVLFVLWPIAAGCGGGKGPDSASPADAEGQPLVVTVPEAQPKPSKKKNASHYPGHGSKQPVPSNRAVDFDLAANGLRINGQLLTHNPTVSEVQAILGNTPRVHYLANTIHAYDDLGITLYQRPNTQTVLELSLYYDFIDAEFMPDRLYAGSLRIGGVDVRQGTRLSQLRSWLDRFKTEYDGSPVYGTYTQVNSSIALYMDVEQDQITQVSIDFPH